ncbi:MAG: beta-lactamase domain protein [Firmicutes bacterium]|nr:beta-lactamase domain protein [Bacillota bacterium]
MKMSISRNQVISLMVYVLMSVLLLCQPTLLAKEQDGLVKVTDNVYTMTSPNSFWSNSGVIIGNDGIVVIDSRISAKEARRLIKDIRAISDKPIKYVINTHCHLDHAFGNFEFAKLGATIISSTIEKENMQKVPMESAYKFFGVPEEETIGTTLAYPNLTFSNKMEIDMGNQKLELIYPGPSHTTGSILIYLPDPKILFIGDTFLNGSIPFMGDGNIPGWINTLEFIKGMDVEKVVPGHGALSSKQDVSDLKDYMILFDQKARELCASSSDLEYIVAEMKKVLPYKKGEDFIRTNIKLQYLKKD